MRYAILILVPLLAACASPGYKEYLSAQAEANKQAAETQKPLFRMTAQPGQPITGLATLEVFVPTTAPVIQQSRPNEWATVLGQGFSVLGTLGGIKLGGDAAIGMASQIRQAGTAGYGFIQAPTTTMTNSTGVLGSGTYQIDNTHAPTIVTQPAPTVVTAPDPLIVQPVVVNTPDPVIVRPEVVLPQ